MFVKKIFLVCAVFLIAAGCQKKQTLEIPTSDDFAALSGKNLPSWEFVQTKEDFEHLTFFERMYELKKGLLTTATDQIRIPKVVHFIWIGPRPFPTKSVENIRTWMAKNPGWTFKFWTDRARPLPAPGMELKMIQDIEFLALQNCFAKSDNYGEKSDLLRYEILYNEGGVYVDHDVKCFRSFDALNAAYDFYCGIDMPYTSCLPSCVFTTNNLIGVKPRHPVLLRCMDLLSEQWDQIEKAYPGIDNESKLTRVLHRTFWLFGEAIKQMSNQEDNRDIVFPAYYFDAPKEELAIYARHQYAGTWHENESPFEKTTRERLMILSKKTNKILLFLGIATALNALGFCALFFLFKKNIGVFKKPQ